MNSSKEICSNLSVKSKLVPIQWIYEKRSLTSFKSQISVLLFTPKKQGVKLWKLSIYYLQTSAKCQRRVLKNVMQPYRRISYPYDMHETAQMLIVLRALAVLSFLDALGKERDICRNLRTGIQT